ncbi:probable leucine-rich repeat receptor-like protein kinase at1g68400 [Phtheirospermum japonicum]|uniref:Probable leucine-rich repeat receptor-like protein kinase at1g68400 n=1 Tax=Phtheirospermum japonicum TaxID=374723 RepID=A0A830C524_9LAMI|nr:probable leucine-rich repeat receptor-like protein kinase at1g68400 [Phtheirospermum japonicum]
MDLLFPFLLFSTSLLCTATAGGGGSAANDTAALSLFLSQTDLHGALLPNWTTTTAAPTACAANWSGVKCTNRRVTAVILPSLNLRGPLLALSSLDQLRLLDLRDNRLSGDLTPITQCPNLKFVYLAGNDLSGDIPPQLFSLHRLLRLDLSNNNLRGPIPTNLSTLSRLLTLKLQNNEISGNIPNSLDSLPNLKQLNLSNNELNGSLPNTLLSKYGENSFSGNQRLCSNSPNFPKCSLPPPNPIIDQPSQNHHNKKLSKAAIISIIVVISFLLFIIISSFTGKRSSLSSENKVHANRGGVNDSDDTNATDQSKLVFFDQKKQFELEDLLRASAEMLGKGSFGTVYKAVLEDGSTVAVKRLKDANPSARNEFEQYMDVIGKIKHPNVVRFRAYYYAREEKLLVYDYLPNASLHSLLHGNRGAGRIPLDWTTRISLILGAARGLAKIHDEYADSRIPHGNVKSSNVLLDKNGIACVSDFGLSLLLNPAHAVSRLGGYRAPEQAETKRLSQKADIYSFGVLLLEVLTGRAPSKTARSEEEEVAVDLPNWVRSMVREEWTAEVFDQELLRYKNIEEELVSMLHVAMACVVGQPEKRPTMAEVVRMVEEIRVAQTPLGEDYEDDSRNSISPSIVAEHVLG